MKRNSPKLRWKIIIEFILFALVIYLGFWFIQNTVSTVLFRKNQINEANNSSDALVKIVETTNISQRESMIKYEEVSREKNECNIYIIYMDGDQLKYAYKNSFFDKQVDFVENDVSSYWTDNYGTNSSFTSRDNDFYATGTFTKDINGTECLVLVKTRLIQVGSDRKLNSTQFIISTVFIFLTAFLFAISLTHQLVQPITSLNNSAKDLAKGKYDSKFKAEGFSEVEELRNTLNYASEELSKMDVYQKELLANVSHDLRTPLTLIGGYAEMMKDMPEERNEDNLQIIIDETKRLNTLVNDILLLSNIQNDNNKLDIESYCITDSIKDIIYRNDKMASELGIKINFEYSELVNIEADEAQITKVIYNFISNAINYCGDDKIVIVKQEVVGDKVKISVIDHGIGIDKDEINNIWDRYYKAKNHVRAQVGSGLGLSIVKNILQRHNFEYGVVSQKNVGSEFYFLAKLCDK